jgi:hypothetical protein
LFQFLEAAISMAFIATHNSATNAEAIPMFLAKPYKKSALEFLNNPPQEEEEELVEAPSVIHFTQLDKDGCQTTSLIVVGLRKCPDVIRW